MFLMSLLGHHICNSFRVFQILQCFHPQTDSEHLRKYESKTKLLFLFTSKIICECATERMPNTARGDFTDSSHVSGWRCIKLWNKMLNLHRPGSTNLNDNSALSKLKAAIKQKTQLASRYDKKSPSGYLPPPPHTETLSRLQRQQGQSAFLNKVWGTARWTETSWPFLLRCRW